MTSGIKRMGEGGDRGEGGELGSLVRGLLTMEDNDGGIIYTEKNNLMPISEWSKPIKMCEK